MYISFHWDFKLQKKYPSLHIENEDTHQQKDRQIRRQIGLREAGRLSDVYVYVSLCPSWASVEQQHRGQVKRGGEIKGSAGACSLCIQSPLSPTPQPACWSNRSERSLAPCHSHTQAQRHPWPLVLSWDQILTIRVSKNIRLMIIM